MKVLSQYVQFISSCQNVSLIFLTVVVWILNYRSGVVYTKKNVAKMLTFLIFTKVTMGTWTFGICFDKIFFGNQKSTTVHVNKYKM